MEGDWHRFGFIDDRQNIDEDRITVPKNLQSENVMDFSDFPLALPFLVIGSAGEPHKPMSAALLRTAA